MKPTERFRQWLEASPGLCLIGQLAILREARFRGPAGPPPAPSPFTPPDPPPVKSDWLPYTHREVGAVNLRRPPSPARPAAIFLSPAIPLIPRDTGETVAAQFAPVEPAIPAEGVAENPFQSLDQEAAFIEVITKRWLPLIAAKIDAPLVFNPASRVVLAATVRRLIMARVVKEQLPIGPRMCELLIAQIFDELIRTRAESLADIQSSGAIPAPAEIFDGPFLPVHQGALKSMPALVPKDEGNVYSMRHVKDLIDFVAEDHLVPTYGPFAWRQIVHRDEHGAMRPLKAAPNLRRGWLYTGLSFEELVQAIRHAYPGALGTWNEWLEERLTVTPYDGTAARQSGRFALVAGLGEERFKAQTAKVCGGCLRQRVWGPNPARVANNDSSIPLICPEACNYFISQAREAMLEEEKEGPETE